jgi:hypothetical protein
MSFLGVDELKNLVVQLAKYESDKGASLKFKLAVCCRPRDIRQITVRITFDGKRERFAGVSYDEYASSDTNWNILLWPLFSILFPPFLVVY